LDENFSRLVTHV